ncbi:methyl-accepting chemotaxis sensory transducer with phytochrome sensor [Calothrix sp. NIES-2100]|uniref:GAF domain-containing protein n=1 Tax=Calothrix sp. NIES-2100 TaxID=1954172 RepID=UPI000B5F4415|nr:methyl-accepting chemotaxis sensory transducer with phytochrome sensor [Calothrix sp. NIES-2100]
MVKQHNLTPSQPHSNSSNGNKDTSNGHTVDVPAKQQIISTLKELLTELDQADWAEIEPLQQRIYKLKELVNVLPLPYQDTDGLEVEQVQEIASKIRQFSDLDTLLATAVMEIQSALQADRVVVYEFTNPTLGIVAAEAMRDGFTPMLKEKLPAVTFGLSSTTLYQQEKLVAIADTYTASLSLYQKQLVDRFQIRACLSLPILTKDGVWGLLVVQQCTAPHQWQNAEIRSLKLLAQELEAQLQVAVIQATLQQEVEKDQILTGVANKILQSKDADTIFRVATQEVRQSLKCDRVAIYRFQPDWSGEFVAESAGSEWVSLLEEQRNNPAIVKNVNYCSVRNLADAGGLVGSTGRSHDSYIQHTQGKTFHRGQIYRVTNDIYSAGFSDCYIKVLESYQAKAYIIVAIFQGEQLWGLLAAYQNSGPRQWKDSEVRLMVQVASLSSIAIQQLQYQQQLYNRSEESAKLIERERTVFRIIEKIGQATDIHNIFRTATQDLRRFLKCDRVVVYQFYPNWSGEIIAESVAAGWLSLLEMQEQDGILKTGLMSSERCTVKEYGSPVKPDADTYLKETQGGIYAKGTRFRKVNDIYAAGFSPCYLETLEKFQAKAYIIVPIFRTGKLWGLLAAYQNSDVRKWTEEETGALLQICEPLSIALQQAEYIEQLRLKNLEMTQVAEVENAIARMAERMRQSQQLETLYRTTLVELRQLFKCDRLAIYRFNSDWGGEFIAESVGSDWVPLVGPDIKTEWKDEHLQQTQGGRYRNNETFVVNDIYTVGHAQCHIDLLEQFQVKAYTIAPIFAGNKLWGLLGAYQNSGPRQWNSDEVRLLTKLGIQLGLSVQQAEYIEQLKKKNTELARTAEGERALTRLAEKIRQAQELDTIFRNALPELRSHLECDRLAVYRFNPDWGGEFIAESVSREWVALVGPDIKTVWEDEHLQQTQGGRYRNNETFVINDIYTSGHAQCHIKILEQFQMRAYIITPIIAGNKLWGLLGAYQNDGPRQWQDNEISFVTKIGTQFGVAVQQSQYLQQTLSKNEELTKLAEREVANARFSYRLPSRLTEMAQSHGDVLEFVQFATHELRQLLKVDRVGVYRFEPDWSGEFVVESVSGDWPKLVGTSLARVRDTYLQYNQGGRYARKESLRVDNIYTVGHDECHIQLLELWGTKAYMISPIFQENRLWGLMGVYQNSAPRQWEQSEEDVLNQASVQIGLALNLADYLTQVRTQEQQLAEAAERERTAREKLQQGAIRVLMALEPSFRGDLTVRAPLSEDEIGTIADGYNTTIQSLRDLVRQVQIAAGRVSENSSNNTTSVVKLSDQAQQQAERLEHALEQLQMMVTSTQIVAADAQRVGQAVQRANNTVQAGDSLMERTVDGILEIRETVSETAKKIKRLGEASQKISKVVSLIENFATQTNLLALNAAIEATRAGEYGKGFAVVADEVRSLAYQSASATTEIERLVQEIQAGTNEVTEAMEIGITQVVQGSNLIDETRHSLSAIVVATNEIGGLVQGITQAVSHQSQQSQMLTEAMMDVSAIARKTSESAIHISESFEELRMTSQQLETSVSQFKVD